MFKELDDLINNSVLPDYSKKIQLYEGERRDVAILFADIKGFTNLSENLDSEQLKILLDKTMLIFTQSVKKYGGYVDKYEGDLIMALFGAKKATVNDTERSILCGLEMLDNLKKINTIIENINSKYHLDIRIGINTGLVTTGKIGEKREGDFTVYGSAVNLASRMESNAPLNRIMLPESCSSIVKNKFSFEPHGLISVKGFSQPVKTFLVNQKLEFNLSSSKSSFVGRESELTKLNENYFQMKNRSPQPKSLILITGTSGIGKTRLIYEFIKDKTNPFIYSITSQFLNPTPFSGLKSLLKSIFRIQDSSTENEIRNIINSKINKLKSCEYSPLLLNLDTEAIIKFLKDEQFKHQIKSSDNYQLLLFSAVKDLILIIAKLAELNKLPLVIIIDNYQELDKLSKNFFNYMSEYISYNHNPIELNLLLILSSQWKIIEQNKLNKQDYLEINLKPLSNSNILAMIESLDSEKKINISLKDKLVLKSNGVPFYLVEFFYLLTNKENCQEFEDIDIPRSIKGLITSRYDNLDQDSKLLLQIASVIGSEFSYTIMEKITSHLDKISDLKNIFGNLIKQQYFFTKDDHTYHFIHQLTRETIYNLILNHNRKILHLRIAQEIEKLDPNQITRYLYDLVEHYYQAGVTEKYSHYLKSAGIYAESKFDFINAEKYLEKYWSLYKNDLSTSSEILNFINILWNLIQAKKYLGKYKQSKDLTEQFLHLSQTHEVYNYQADAYNYLAELNKLDGDYNQAKENFNKAFSLYQQTDNLFKQSVIIGEFGEIELYNRNFTKAVNYFEKQLKISEKLSENKLEALGYYYNNMATFYFQQDNFDEAIHYQQKDLHLAKKLNHKVDIAIETGNLGYSYMMLNDIEKADKYLQQYLQLCQKLFFKKGIMMAYDYLSIFQFKQKNYPKALYYAQQQHKIAEQLCSNKDLAFSFSSLSRIYWKIGDLDKSKNLTEKSLNLVIKMKDVLGELVLKAELAKIYKYKHDYISAEKTFLEVIDRMSKVKSPGHYFDMIFQLAELYLITGQTDKLINCLKEISLDECIHDDLTSFQINLLLDITKILNRKTHPGKVIEKQNESSLDLPKSTIFNFYLFLTSKIAGSDFNKNQISDFKNKSISLLKFLIKDKKIYPYYFYLELIGEN